MIISKKSLEATIEVEKRELKGEIYCLKERLQEILKMNNEFAKQEKEFAIKIRNLELALNKSNELTERLLKIIEKNGTNI